VGSRFHPGDIFYGEVIKMRAGLKGQNEPFCMQNAFLETSMKTDREL
jgi:hypothetical protein